MKNSIFITIIVILGILLYTSEYQRISLSEENKRLSKNCTVLNNEIDTLVSKNGELLIRTGELTYTIDELKKYKSDAIKIIKDAGVKPKNVNEYQEGITEVILHDTVMLTKYENYASGKYNDNWMQIDFTVSDDTMDFSMIMVDSIDVVLYQMKEQWRLKNLFKKRDVSYYTLTQNRCPYATTIIKSIKIK